MIRVISGEPFSSTAEKLIALSREFGAEVRDPTPLVSPFWNTTFTPSSTEVYARELATDSRSKIITTLQPCIRFVDFGGLGDDFHSLFFYMWSCFFKEAISGIDDHMEVLFRTIETASSTKRGNWFATYHPVNGEKYVDTHLTKSFGLQLLNKIGVPEKNCLAVAGTSTYLRPAETTREPSRRSNHLSGTPAEQVAGPRIELFVELENGLFLEIATLVLFSGTLKLPSGETVDVPLSLAVAVGIERLSVAYAGENSFFDLGIFKAIHDKIVEAFPSKVTSRLFNREVKALTALLIASLAIENLAPNIPNRSNFGPNKERRRIERETRRLGADMGISRELLDHLQEKITYQEG